MGKRIQGIAVALSVSAILVAGCGDRDTQATIPESAAAGDSLYGVSAAENLRVVPVEVEVENLPEGWDGIRIVAISDFQLGLWEDNARVAEAATRRAASLRPDLVVLLGDYVARGDQTGVLERVLAPLRGIQTMAVLGDRDEPESDPGPADSATVRLVETLNRSGVVVLRNERGRFVRGGDTAYVAGIAPHVPRRPEWRQAEVFNAIPRSGSTPILLSHLPAGALAAPDSTYPLVLSGHTNCGRVEVAGSPRLSWVHGEQLAGGRIEGTDRLYRLDGNGLFITCGVGYSFLPARLGAPPEIALIVLRRPGATAAAPADTAGVINEDSLLQQFGRSAPARTDTAGDTATAPAAPPEP